MLSLGVKALDMISMNCFGFTPLREEVAFSSTALASLPERNALGIAAG